MNIDQKSIKDMHPRIVVRILHPLREYGELGKTKLAWASNVSYDALQIYLSILVKNKLVVISVSESGHEIVRITNEGMTALNELSKWY